MNHCILPSEICIIIALCRPIAFARLSVACRALHFALQAHSGNLQQRWIRRVNYTTIDEDGRQVKIYTGMCPNGDIHGEHKILDVATNKLTDVYNFRFGVLHGSAYEVDAYKYKKSYNFENGLLHGMFKEVGGGYRIDLLRINYEHGLKHGPCVAQYISGGRRWEIHFERDQLHGKATFWYPDERGMCCTESWRHGKLHGTRTFYEMGGNITCKENWRNGLLDGTKTYVKKFKGNLRLEYDICNLNADAPRTKPRCV
ncbi:MORN-repeat protein [Faustovirus]|nr:MORN-repeat protein [Faustovirus]